MSIPGVGVFNVHDGLAAVAFEDALVGHTQHTTNKHLSSAAKKQEARGFLTKEAMERFQLAEVGLRYEERT